MSLRPMPLLACALLVCAALSTMSTAAGADEGVLGYYRYPAVHGNTVVFTAEGDLWRVPITGGMAERLTSHPGEESRAAFSPDGRWIAFSAAYDGPVEVYVMPAEGGLPQRLTWEGGAAGVVGWTPKGEVMYATRRWSTLPQGQLFTVDPKTSLRRAVPLAQASDGVWAGGSLVFTRFEFQGSQTRRYRGGRVQQLWSWAGGKGEASPLFAGDSTTSKNPMIWRDRLYFIGDRDGAMNLWTAATDGRDARALTHHREWDVRYASLDAGRIVYQLGADLRVYDIATGDDRAIPIRLVSDYDQLREKWVKGPMDYATSIHLSPNGDRVTITARGQVFVLPAKQGRTVDVTRDDAVRYRQARFMPDGKSLVALGDASGEVELTRLPANGVGAPEQLTRDGHVLRWQAVPSPDGKWIAHTNKDQELWLYEAATGHDTRIAVSETWADIDDLAWSPDSRWLAFTRVATDLLTQIQLYGLERRTTTALTTDRWDSVSPAWSPDGKWLWFLSDRHFDSVVRSIWGSRQPEPYWDRPTRIYGLALQRTFRSPFAPADELHPAESGEGGEKGGAEEKSGAKKTVAVTPVAIDLDGIQDRLVEAPVDPGNYGSLSTDGKRLYVLDTEPTVEAKQTLRAIPIGREKEDPATLMADVRSYELSADRKKLLVRKNDALYVFDAGAKPPAELDKSLVSQKDWSFTVDPRAEFRQMFTEGWRLERDYFYDRRMHGVDWAAVRERFKPLAARVTDRAELSDLFAQMIGELSALHMFVRGGDLRSGPDQAEAATLGALLERDEAAGGWRIARIYRSDPDTPERRSPLAAPDLDVREGDVIQAVNGVATLSVPDPHVLLRGQTDRQVLLRLARGGASREVVVKPLAPARDTDLRYASWEYARRLRVDSLGAGKIGYVHLRAMGPGDMAQWARDFYPVFNRDGLIVDVRHNNGGNIDSWILGRLLRRNWFWWKPRVGEAAGNMPFAFRGRMIVLVDEATASDGEAFAEGFRRLGLGPVLGTRTWGGEIWLSSSNFLVDRGIATAAETGVFAPEGEWLIEGHGVDPDVVVENLPRATYDGGDAQLDRAVQYLMDVIRRQPTPAPKLPPYPDKSGRK